MAFLGNIIWVVNGGFVISFFYLVGAIFLFPLLPFLLPLVSYSLWPFGKKPVSIKAINAYKEENNMPLEENKFAKASSVVKVLANLVWIVTFGFLLAICHFIFGLIFLVLCIFIVTIPWALASAMGHFKLIPVALKPFGLKIIPATLADDINLAHAKSKL